MVSIVVSNIDGMASPIHFLILSIPYLLFTVYAKLMQTLATVHETLFMYLFLSKQLSHMFSKANTYYLNQKLLDKTNWKNMLYKFIL